MRRNVPFQLHYVTAKANLCFGTETWVERVQNRKKNNRSSIYEISWALVRSNFTGQNNKWRNKSFAANCERSRTVVSELGDTLRGVRGLCVESYSVKFNMLLFSKCYDVPVYKLALKLIYRNIKYSDFKNKRLKNCPLNSLHVKLKGICWGGVIA
jgi:hypothetical protein